MKKTLLAALLLGTTVTTHVDAAIDSESQQSASTSQPLAHTNPHSVVAGLSRGVATTVYSVGKELFDCAGRVISSFFQKNGTYVPTNTVNAPFGNIDDPKHLHSLAMKSDAKDESVTPPSTRAASAEPATSEAIDKDDDRMSASSSSEFDLLTNAEKRTNLEAFIQTVLAEDQKATGDTHDPLEDSIVFVEEDAATPSEASTEAAKPTVKAAAKTTKKSAPTVRMTRAQQLLAQSKAAENAAKAKKEEEKKAPKPAGKKPTGKKVVVKR